MCLIHLHNQAAFIGCVIVQMYKPQKKRLTNEEKYGIIIKLSRRDAKNLEKNSLFLYGKQNHIEKEFEKVEKST